MINNTGLFPYNYMFGFVSHPDLFGTVLLNAIAIIKGNLLVRWVDSPSSYDVNIPNGLVDLIYHVIRTFCVKIV